MYRETERRESKKRGGEGGSRGEGGGRTKEREREEKNPK